MRLLLTLSTCLAHSCKAALLAVPALFVPPAQAEEFTAGVVIERMEPSERYTFVSGIVEGLAHARFQADGHTEGRSCIYKWFYAEDGTADNVFAAFAKFPDYLPGAIVGAMIERRCG